MFWVLRPCGRTREGRTSGSRSPTGRPEQCRGALYEKATLPFVSYVVTDGNLVTGQNPGSAKATAKKVVESIEGNASKRRG